MHLEKTERDRYASNNFPLASQPVRSRSEAEGPHKEDEGPHKIVNGSLRGIR